MKLTLSYILIIFFGLFAGSCNEKSPVPRVSKIIDMSSDETMPIELSYDSKGRLTTFGPTSLSYKHDMIIASNSKEMLGYGRYYSMVFTLDNDRVVKTESHCDQKIFGKMTEVKKMSTYSYSGNQIILDSKSYDIKSHKILRQFREVREIGENGKLVKVIDTDSNREDGVALYKYDSNLACRANINLQAFTYSANGLDDLLVYLLNLNKIPQINVLPDEANYAFASGINHLYNENCCMDDDRLTRLEVMMNYETLIVRMNFEYEENNDK